MYLLTPSSSAELPSSGFPYHLHYQRMICSFTCGLYLEPLVGVASSDVPAATHALVRKSSTLQSISAISYKCKCSFAYESSPSCSYHGLTTHALPGCQGNPHMHSQVARVVHTYLSNLNSSTVRVLPIIFKLFFSFVFSF